MPSLRDTQGDGNRYGRPPRGRDVQEDGRMSRRRPFFNIKNNNIIIKKRKKWIWNLDNWGLGLE